MPDVPLSPPIYAVDEQAALGSALFNGAGMIPFEGSWPGKGGAGDPGEQYANYVQNSWAEKMAAPDSVDIYFRGFEEVYEYSQSLFKSYLCSLAYLDKVRPGALTMQQFLFDEAAPENVDVYDPDQLEGSGGIGTPFLAMAHYLFGSGKKLIVPLPQLGISLTPNDIKINGVNQLDTIINDTSFVGTKPILVEKFSYNTADSSYIAGSYIGNMSLKLEGNITRNSDGTWQLTGVIRAYDDYYDFNASDHRSAAQEAFTYLIREGFIGTPFNVGMPGEIPVSWNQNDKK